MQGVWSEVAWLNDSQFLFIGRAGSVPDAGTSALWISDIDGRHLARVTREFGFFMNLSLTGDRTTAVAKKFTRVSGIWISGPSGLEAEIKVPVSPAGAGLPRGALPRGRPR
jgi:hypothetical protein